MAHSDRGGFRRSVVVPQDDEERFIAGGLAAAFANRRRTVASSRQGSENVDSVLTSAGAGLKPWAQKKDPVAMTIPLGDAEDAPRRQMPVLSSRRPTSALSPSPSHAVPAPAPAAFVPKRPIPTLTSQKLFQATEALQRFRTRLSLLPSGDEGDALALSELERLEFPTTDSMAKKWAAGLLPEVAIRGFSKTLERLLDGPPSKSSIDLEAGAAPDASTGIAAAPKVPGLGSWAGNNENQALFEAVRALTRACGAQEDTRRPSFRDTPSKESLRRCISMLSALPAVREAFVNGCSINPRWSAPVHRDSNCNERGPTASLLAEAFRSGDRDLVRSLFELLPSSRVEELTDIKGAAGPVPVIRNRQQHPRAPIIDEPSLLAGLDSLVEKDDVGMIEMFLPKTTTTATTDSSGGRPSLPLLQRRQLYRFFRQAVVLGSFDIANTLLFAEHQPRAAIIAGLRTEAPHFSTILAAMLNGMTPVVRTCLQALVRVSSSNDDGERELEREAIRARDALIDSAPGHLLAAFMALVKGHNASHYGREALKRAILADSTTTDDNALFPTAAAGARRARPFLPLAAHSGTTTSSRYSARRAAAIRARLQRWRAQAGRPASAPTKATATATAGSRRNSGGVRGKPWGWLKEQQQKEDKERKEAKGAGNGPFAKSPALLSDSSSASLSEAFARRFGGATPASASGVAGIEASASSSAGSLLSGLEGLAVQGKAVPLIVPQTDEEMRTALAANVEGEEEGEGEGGDDSGKEPATKGGALQQQHAEDEVEDEGRGGDVDEEGEDDEEEGEEPPAEAAAPAPPPPPPYRFQCLVKPQRDCLLALLELCPRVYSSPTCVALHPRTITRPGMSCAQEQLSSFPFFTGYVPVPADAVEVSCHISPRDQYEEERLGLGRGGGVGGGLPAARAQVPPPRAVPPRRDPFGGQHMPFLEERRDEQDELPVPALLAAAGMGGHGGHHHLQFGGGAAGGRAAGPLAPAPVAARMTRLYLPLEVREDVSELLGQEPWKRRRQLVLAYHYIRHQELNWEDSESSKPTDESGAAPGIAIVLPGDVDG
jgi:hypothetical protein